MITTLTTITLALLLATAAIGAWALCNIYKDTFVRLKPENKTFRVTHEILRSTTLSVQFELFDDGTRTEQLSEDLRNEAAHALAKKIAETPGFLDIERVQLIERHPHLYCYKVSLIVLPRV